jgi:hypothetical protein
MVRALWEVCSGNGSPERPCTAEQSARWRAVWDGLPVSPRAAPRTRPCVHLGPPTGARRLCPSCSGHVEVKVLACVLYGACTVARRAEGLQCCATCPDYRAGEGS